MGKEELQETQEVEACVDGASEAATLEVAEADYLADGDRDAVGEGHHSGMPCRRHFVPGGDDPRDAAISETSSAPRWTASPWRCRPASWTPARTLWPAPIESC